MTRSGSYLTSNVHPVRQSKYQWNVARKYELYEAVNSQANDQTIRALGSACKEMFSHLAMAFEMKKNAT